MTTDDVSALLKDLTAVLDQQTGQITDLKSTVDAQNAQLDHFVPKRRFRLVIGGVVLAIVVALILVLVFRERDADEARRRRAQLELDQEQDRQNLIRGCERANDQRASLRRTIERGYAPVEYPPEMMASLPPALRDLIVQSQERQAALRVEQLSDPGVQSVDCAAQFPPPRETA